MEGMDRSYAGVLRWSLRHPMLIVSTSALVVVGGFLLVPFIGLELQPEADEGQVRVRLELAEGTRLEVTDQLAHQAERLVRERVPELDNLLVEVGSRGGWRTANTNTVTLRVYLVPLAQRERSSQQIADALRPLFADFPGVVPRVRTSGGNYAMRWATESEGDRLSIDIRGHDMNECFDLAVRIKRIMESLEGVSDAAISRSPGRPESHIRIDRAKAATMGLTVSNVATTVRASIGGTVASYYREGGDEYEILVRYREEDRLSSEDVMAIPIQTPAGSVVPLRSLVDLNRSEGPNSISRKDQQRIVSVSGNLSGTRDMGSVVRELEAEVRPLATSPDIALVFSGEWEEQEEARFLLQISFLLAVILVYLVMAAQFESFKYPFLIMFSIPLAFTGVILALFLTQTNFNLQGFIGLIMLVGIVVNNAIVLVDYVLQLHRRHGLALMDALVTGGRRRLRPILMTTLTTVLGLTPMAIGIGEGAELQVPMARVLIGGLISSTFMTLFLIPTLFLILERLWGYRRRESPDLALGQPSSVTG